MSKISIITINYNNLEGLKRTVESVVNQTWQEFEYIVIDGGSTDGSREFMENHCQDFDCWLSESDTGIYNAMNKGIAKAKGEYLLFLNSGDWLCNEKVIESVFFYMTNFDLYYGNLVKVYPNNEKVIDKGVNGIPISLNTFVKGTLNHGSSFIKKELFLKYGLYDETLKIVSDWKFFLIALGLNNSRVKYLDIEISFFNMDGISNSNLKLRNEERANVLKEVVPIPILRDNDILNQFQQLIDPNQFQVLTALHFSSLFKKMNLIWFKVLFFFMRVNNKFLNKS
ncbi:glycosyltransferase family 2 protein [Flavobacterium taihuense]|uniref:Glycosyltransferase n=1 Tax=Flavobacterium taihuense TaxID=2857508 RepID=A0ABS6XUP4_9FLAO|nr:glycosyltransferase family 2 protein [Flavobacterium taihuense]MBW4360366.1 glycosyltransferase [Flavobacterium taihuense]